jgi:mono/diheme cytochrome c family protein
MAQSTPPAWLELLLSAAHRAEQILLQGLHAVGLTGTSHGQPAWPFASRIADQTLLIDLGYARSVGLALAMIASALLLLAVAILWRRARWPALAASALLCVFAPKPAANLLFEEAYPTTFHKSPTQFAPAAIASGERLYRRNCASCHGAGADGDGALAGSLAKWPPTLVGGLLWERTEGELFWRIQHGMRDSTGTETMPGFTGKLSDEDTWALLDFLKANASGSSVALTGKWNHPIAAPEALARCREGRLVKVSELRGQNLRVVFGGNGVRALPDEPRLVTIAVSDSPFPGADCVANGPGIRDAYSMLTGVPVDRLAGTQFLIDRAGWLRARTQPGATNWSASDNLCTSTRAGSVASGASRVDGLGTLIARFDADPVVTARGHAWH